MHRMEQMVGDCMGITEGSGNRGERAPMDHIALLREMAKKMPGGFFAYRADLAGEVLFVNDIVLDIFGCESVEEFLDLTGGTFSGMVLPEDYKAVLDSVEQQVAAHKRNLDYVEYRIRRKDGAIRWVDDHGRLVHTEQEGDVYYVLLRDITEQCALREEKLRMERDLEREKHANEAKASFLFNISHDIRTPMNTIVGFTELARHHIDNPKLLQECLEKVEEANQHMMMLIDDLLEMSSIDYGGIELHPEECDLEQQMDLVLGLFQSQADEKHIFLEKDLSIPADHVLMDTVRFRRVLGNLIGNAIKFTPSQGRVTLSARQMKTSASGYARYEFVVADTGIGMSEEFMKRMFDAFERAETSTKSGYIGTGLGLSIARNLVHIMGGSIHAESKLGEGSSLFVDLPLKLVGKERQAKAVAEPQGPEHATGGQRILLVEDIDVNRIMAEMMLKEAGFRVESVVDGCDAVEAIQEHPPGYYDAVLMDIQMPIMNGYEATRAIRALGREDAKLLPIIALSANAREQDKQMSRESGMNSHVAKPFDLANLIRTINNHIDTNAAAKE